MIEPEDDGCGYADGGHEGAGASIVAGVDAPPVFEPAEHDLDLVALAVERGIVRDWYFPVALCGDAGGDLALRQGGSEPVGVVAPVTQQRLGLG